MPKIEVFIPEELAPMAKDLDRFFSAMVFKLRRNAHKGRWEGLDIDTAFRLMRGEVDELRVAIQEGSFAEVLMEGADVANFALIVTSVSLEADRLLSTPGRPDEEGLAPAATKVAPGPLYAAGAPTPGTRVARLADTGYVQPPRLLNPEGEE